MSSRGETADDSTGTGLRTGPGPRAAITKVPWPTLKAASETFNGRLTPTDRPGHYRLEIPRLPRVVAVCPDPGLTRFCVRYQLGPCPQGDRAWATVVSEPQGALWLARYALEAGQLVVAAEIPMEEDEEMLAVSLDIVRADLRAALAFRTCLSTDQLADFQPGGQFSCQSVSPQVRAKSEEVIHTWLQEATLAGWQSVTDGHGWRLVRAPWAPPEFPPACYLGLGPATLTAGSAIPLQGTATPETHQALALFLLQHNARSSARARLDTKVAPLTVQIEQSVPVQGLDVMHLTEAVSAVTAAYGNVRWEVEALCDPIPAELFLEIAHARLAGSVQNGRNN